MNNNKNVLLAIMLAAATLFVWQYFVATPAMKAEQARQAALSHQAKPQAQHAPAPSAAPELPGIAVGSRQLSREDALKADGARVAIDTPMVDGSILLKGARFDDLRQLFMADRDRRILPKSLDREVFIFFYIIGHGAAELLFDFFGLRNRQA